VIHRICVEDTIQDDLRFHPKLSHVSSPFHFMFSLRDIRYLSLKLEVPTSRFHSARAASTPLFVSSVGWGAGQPISADAW
jgi:hypothetical protein